MTLRSTIAALCAGALLVSGSCAWAQETPPDHYTEGLRALSEGRTEDATRAFALVIEAEPQHAGAWLDLALIQCAMGNRAEAERMFGVIEQRFAPPQGIREMIVAARRTGCLARKPMAQVSLSLGRGIDGNVNQGASDPFYTIIQLGKPVVLPLLPEFLPQKDQYTSGSAEYIHPLSQNGSAVFVQAQARRNDKLSAYDSVALFAGAETALTLGEWKARASLAAGGVTLGGKLYQRQAQVQGRLRAPVLPRLPAYQLELVGALTQVQHATLDNFDAFLAEARTQLTHRSPGRTVSGSVGMLRDHAKGDRPGGHREGWFASLYSRFSIGGNATGEASYVFRTWDSDSLYAPGTVDVMRHQESHVLRAAVTYPLARNHNLVLEARKTWNRENIAIFKYNSALLQLSWQWNGH